MGAFLTKVAIGVGCCLFLLQSVPVLSTTQPTSTWFHYYQPIEDPKAVQFARRGLAYAEALLGAAQIPATTVHLRLSVPLDPASALKKYFQLTETTDPETGTFTIYLSCRPGQVGFEGQLAHEICHLLNGNLQDAYAEGICTAFAEKFLTREGRDWNRWREHLTCGEEPFYGATYAMMKDIWEIVGNRQIGKLLTFARNFPDGSGRMYLDVPGWLGALPKQMRCNVMEVINLYKTDIERHIETTGTAVKFETPS